MVQDDVEAGQEARGRPGGSDHPTHDVPTVSRQDGLTRCISSSAEVRAHVEEVEEELILRKEQVLVMEFNKDGVEDAQVALAVEDDRVVEVADLVRQSALKGQSVVTHVMAEDHELVADEAVDKLPGGQANPKEDEALRVAKRGLELGVELDVKRHLKRVSRIDVKISKPEGAPARLQRPIFRTGCSEDAGAPEVLPVLEAHSNPVEARNVIGCEGKGALGNHREVDEKQAHHARHEA